MLLRSPVACLTLGIQVLAMRMVAQAPSVLTATRDLMVDAATADLSKPVYMIVSRTGEILITDRSDGFIHVFAPTGGASTMGRVGEGPGEFRNLTRIGFIGDSVWTLDPSLKRISIFGPDHKFSRSFIEPATVVSSAASKDTIEIAHTYVQALLSDGSLRAIASFSPSRRPSWARDVDSGYTLIVRVAPNGILKGRLAVFAPSGCAVNFNMPNGKGSTSIPFCAERLSTDWDGTGPVASATLDPARGESTAYRVTLFAENGVEQFNRTYPFTPVVVSQAALDSSATAREKTARQLGPAWASSAPAMVPARHYPPVRGIVVGRDGTVWIDERAALPGHHWRALDSKGTVIATLALPESVSLKCADLHTAWGLETDTDGLASVVRYRLERRKT